MARKVIGISLLIACVVGLVGEFVAIRELCDADYSYSNDRGLNIGADAWVHVGAQAWVLVVPFLAFAGLRLIWPRGGWAGWLTSIGFGLLVGALTFGVAILTAAADSGCRIDV